MRPISAPACRASSARGGRNKRLVAALSAFAAERDASAAQIALAWLLAKGRRGPAIVPIPGTSRPRYVGENAAAAELVLAEPEIATLDALFAPGAVAGDRYPPEEAVRVGT